jgi:hypothetical protein
MGKEGQSQMTTNEHLALHDKQIRAIRDLVKEGIQLVVRSRQDTRREIKELIAAHKRLDASQARTDASLKALIDQMRRSGGNGPGKGKVDLQ